MKNNRGVTLVELLLAFAISAIVLTAIAAMIFSGLKMFGRTNAHVELQSEVQTAMNLIVDNIMDADGICMKNPVTGTHTDCILLNALVVTKQPGGDYKAFFSGSSLVTDIDTLDANGNPLREIYLVDFPNADFPLVYSDSGKDYCELVASAATPEQAATQALTVVHNYIYGLPAADRVMWLLSRYVTECRVEVARPADFIKKTTYHEGGTEEYTYCFKEPLTLHIVLSYENKYSSDASITSNLEDEVNIRSRVKSIFADVDVNVGGTVETGMREFKRNQ